VHSTQSNHAQRPRLRRVPFYNVEVPTDSLAHGPLVYTACIRSQVHDCKCTHDALLWIMLLKQELGVEWIVPALLRIGGEDLLPDMQRSLHSISSGADTYKR
jgi:hypothetical protein